MAGRTGPGSNDNAGVLRIPQSSSITGISSSDSLVSYPGHSLGGRSYPSAEVQSVYSTAPADWAMKIQKIAKTFFPKWWIWHFLLERHFKNNLIEKNRSIPNKVWDDRVGNILEEMKDEQQIFRNTLRSFKTTLQFVKKGKKSLRFLPFIQILAFNRC